MWITLFPRQAHKCGPARMFIHRNTNFKPSLMKSLMRNILSKCSRRKDYHGVQADLKTGMGANTHRGEPWACLKYISLYTQVFLHSLIFIRWAAIKYIFCLFCFKNEMTIYNGIHSVVSILLMSSTESMRLLIRNLQGEASKTWLWFKVWIGTAQK